MERSIRDWHNAAVCAQTDPELFFPTKGGDNVGRLTKARGICKVCPVRVDCVNDAISHKDSYGVRAGIAGKTLGRLVSKGIPIDDDQLVDLTTRHYVRRLKPPEVLVPVLD